VPKRHCTQRAEWRLPPGKPAEHLSPYYQLGCDYGTALMTVYNDGDASEPLYLCETHAAEMPQSRKDGTTPRSGAQLRADPGTDLRTAQSIDSHNSGDSHNPRKNDRKTNSAKAAIEDPTEKTTGDIPARAALQRETSAPEVAHAAAHGAGTRLEIINRKISKHTLAIEAVLAESTAKIKLAEVVDKPLEQATLEIIGDGALGDAEKDAAIARLGALQEWIHRGLEQEITPLQASRIARDIRDRVDGEAGADIPEELKPAYRAIYKSVREAIRDAVPEWQNLEERLNSLYAAKAELENVNEAKALHPQTA
jgi:hypothetical protein